MGRGAREGGGSEPLGSPIPFIRSGTDVAQKVSLKRREMICIFSSVHWLLKSKLIALWRSELKRKIGKRTVPLAKKGKLTEMFVNM